jgi:hydrogenase maturation protein HypF
VIETDPLKVFEEIHGLILEGNIIAIKNTSGYLLCCDARNEKAIRELRRRKRRPAKPLAVLYPSLSSLEADLHLFPEQKKELTSAERPIVLIESGEYAGPLALESLAPGLRQLGVMLPYTALLAMMMREIPFPLVATSGNIHGSPIISREEEAEEALRDVADYFLHHNLEVTNPQDDSVVKYSGKTHQKIFYRRSRGYAPNYYGTMPSCSKKVMAMGAHLKSTIAFYPNDFLYLSQYLGNLDHLDVYRRFTQTAQFFTELFEMTPNVVLCDLHPGYGSTQFGRSQGEIWKAEVLGIQHHKAHFAAVLGEHGIFGSEEPILGVIWDGTGYGEDGAVWGGEFFRYDHQGMERLAHFEYFPWLAGDKMALEPRLSLFSLAQGEAVAASQIGFSPEEIRIYEKLRSREDLKTSSVGRIFDAVAALLDVCHFNTYEGEAAILLENQVSGFSIDECQAYIQLGEDYTISSQGLIENIATDLKSGTSIEQIIRNFLYTLATLIFQVAERKGLGQIACSGGVFQNATLVDMIREIGKDNYKLYFNTALSPNDENIAFGQMAYYLNSIGKS